MQTALRVIVLEGLKTNAALHAAIMNDDVFRADGVDTNYLPGLLTRMEETMRKTTKIPGEKIVKTKPFAPAILKTP